MSGYLRLRKRSMSAKTPMMIRRALISMSPTKKTHHHEVVEEGERRRRQPNRRAPASSAGQRVAASPRAVVLPISSETGTISYPLRAQRIDQHRQRRDRWAARSPPPSCIRMMLPRNCGFSFMIGKLVAERCRRSPSGVLRGCSSQSLVSILLPMMV